MARIIYGGLVTEIKGSVGGTTFQSNRYGYTIKNKPNINVPSSADQFQQKARMQAMARQWQTLSNSERSAWNAWATTYPQASSKNPAAYLNGYNLFQRYNQNLKLRQSNLLLTEPIDPPGSLGSPLIELFLEMDNLYVYIQDADPGTDWYALGYLSRPISVTQSYIKSWTRLMSKQGVSGSSLSFINITGQYVAKFGSLPVENDIIAAEFTFIQQDSGQVIYIPKTQLLVQAL